jgi:polysaccharide pyruvyl transferase WcaK-like protein
MIKKKAIILNFTADSYHWGCYGTSLEIYQTLIEENYYIDTVSVGVTHTLTPTVEKNTDFDDVVFFENFKKNNSDLCARIYSSDLVVVNGEGTLHRINRGPLNLLYMMYMSKKYFGKKICLINFSCFPNGDTSAANNAGSIYASVLRHLDSVVARENISKNILNNEGVNATLGFDCLPRWLNRSHFVNSHEPKKYLLISGGVNLTEKHLSGYKKIINWAISSNIKIIYLTGAKAFNAPEDLRFWSWMEEKYKKEIELINAKTFEEWAAVIKNASFLLSSRFHHTVAALSIGTPSASFISNTPKINAILELLNENKACIDLDDESIETLKNDIYRSVNDVTTDCSENRVNLMLELSEQNFIGIRHS